MQTLKNIGWEILDLIRRGFTPFFIKMMFGMTMLAVLFIENISLRIILVLLLLGADGVLTFMLVRSTGEQAYKMKVAGQLRRENKPIGAENAGSYRPCKEYRGYKGFAIGFVAGLVAIVLIIVSGVTGSTGARIALMFACGWAYVPVAAVYMIILSSTGMEVIPVSSVWYALILVGVLIVICGIAYIVGGNKEKLRQFMLERSTQTIEKGKSARAQSNAQNGKGAGKR